MKTALHYVWYGIWTGFGVEISFFVLWAASRVAHSRLAERLHPEHWMHEIHDYFSS